MHTQKFITFSLINFRVTQCHVLTGTHHTRTRCASLKNEL